MSNEPFFFDNNHCVFYDVDNTLVHWGDNSKTEMNIEGWHNDFIDPYTGTVAEVTGVNLDHIYMLKRHRAQGYKIVVWSHGGAGWAKEVVEKLNLKEYVDVIMAKPREIVDDTSMNHWAFCNHYCVRGYGR